MIPGIYDHHRRGSWAARLRRRRMQFFKQLVEALPKPVSILDAGGTENFWVNMGFAGNPDYQITIVNLESAEVHSGNLKSLAGDVRDLGRFADRSFDVVFSNSVIEHVGDFEDQRKMASEIERVGKNLFLQTPNRYFPVEPHFVFPFFQFLPVSCRVFLIRHFSLGWRHQISDPVLALKEAQSVRLLTRRELAVLFPGAGLQAERLLGIVKSFMIYRGFQR